MKITIVSVFLLLFLFSTKSCLFSVTNAQGEPLYDIDGDKVLSYVPYYLVSSIRGAGGGGLYPTWSENYCPRTVAQHLSDLERGTPVELIHTTPREEVINVGDEVSIQFVPPIDPLCRTSTRWVVSEYSSWEQRWWINTGDIGGLKSFFKFEGSRDFYNIVACYSNCDSSVTICSQVDVFEIEGFGRRLGFGNGGHGPWPFYFAKAPAEATIQQVVGKEPK